MKKFIKGFKRCIYKNRGELFELTLGLLFIIFFLIMFYRIGGLG